MIINPSLIIVACLFIVFDIVTGVLSAFITGTFKSSVMRKGGLRKLFLCVVIGFGVLLDYAQHVADLGFSVPACSAICIYIILMEIMSCIENFNKAVPGALPPALTKLLYSAAENTGITDNKDKTE